MGYNLNVSAGRQPLSALKLMAGTTKNPLILSGIFCYLDEPVACCLSPRYRP